MSKRQSIFDRLTDTSLYTGTHKGRFDDNGRGRGKAGRDSVAKGTGHGALQSFDVPNVTLDRQVRQTRAQPQQFSFDSASGTDMPALVGRRTPPASMPRQRTPPPRSPTAAAAGSTAKPTNHAAAMGTGAFKATRPQIKKGSIFDRLTDSSRYTGTHQHRFDAGGRGRGRAGRDTGIDSQTHDLSQMTRPTLR
eukprot:gnl/Trimastix_PCT/1477.p1 GENE.gnl/Trimastix_PCT/1477~~gnl/Trimastix_PCT/1477.p1  ORF type:complete len:193 (+),score=24.04 gnl/Trimastix_PCT/1477:82-660(+)